MRGVIIFIVLMALSGCSSNDMSWLSVKNETTIPIFVLPYSSEYTNSDWIQPGVSNDFYSIENDFLDAFDYFSLYYDSLIVLMEGHEDEPIKFYKDGKTVNYNPGLNPFINPDVWKVQNFNRAVSGSGFNTLEEKHIYEHYFSIQEEHVKSLLVENGSDPDL